jgi:hypothetical protein
MATDFYQDQSLSSLNASCEAFKAGKIQQSASNSQADSMQSLAPPAGGAMGSMMTGSITKADVEKISEAIGKAVVDLFMPGNPLAILAGPVLGKALGGQLAAVIPTDLKLFPSPLKKPPSPANPQYEAKQKQMSKEVQSLQDSMSLSKLPNSLNSVLGSLDVGNQKDSAKVDKQIDSLVNMLENPMAEFSKSFPLVAQQMGMYVPGAKNVQDTRAKIEASVSKTSEQMKKDLKNTPQENRNAAQDVAQTNQSYMGMLPGMISGLKASMSGTCSSRAAATTSSEEKAYNEKLAKDIESMDVQGLAADVGQNLMKGEMESLLRTKEAMFNVQYAFKNLLSEYQQNSEMDSSKTWTEQYLATTYGVPRDTLASTKRTLVTNVKFLAGLIKIANKLKTSMNAVQTTLNSSFSAGLMKALPGANMSDISTFSAGFSNQVPSQNSMAQSAGTDNLGSTGSALMSQLNSQKEKMAAAGLVK